MLSFLPSTLTGFLLFNVLTHPDSVVWKSFPKIKTKRIQVFPSIRIFARGKIIHFHHWFYLSIILVISMFADGGILTSHVIQGILLGGAIQGYSIPSARKLIYDQE